MKLLKLRGRRLFLVVCPCACVDKPLVFDRKLIGDYRARQAAAVSAFTVLRSVTM